MAGGFVSKTSLRLINRFFHGNKKMILTYRVIRQISIIVYVFRQSSKTSHRLLRCDGLFGFFFSRVQCDFTFAGTDRHIVPNIDLSRQ